MQTLTVDEMKTVLTRPKNALCKQYKQLFTSSNTDFRITTEALQEVAIAACKRKSGARGLRSILEHLLQDAMFEVSLGNHVISIFAPLLFLSLNFLTFDSNQNCRLARERTVHRQQMSNLLEQLESAFLPYY